MTFTTFCRLLSQAVFHSRQPVALNWARNSFGLVLTVSLRKICILGIAEYFLIVLFQISEIKKHEIRFKKYIFLLDMFLIVGGEGSSNRNASRDESVEAGDKSVEAGDESIEAGEKTPQSCYNDAYMSLGLNELKYVDDEYIVVHFYHIVYIYIYEYTHIYIFIYISAPCTVGQVWHLSYDIFCCKNIPLHLERQQAACWLY